MLKAAAAAAAAWAALAAVAILNHRPRENERKKLTLEQKGKMGGSLGAAR